MRNAQTPKHRFIIRFAYVTVQCKHKHKRIFRYLCITKLLRFCWYLHLRNILADIIPQMHFYSHALNFIYFKHQSHNQGRET